MEGDAVRSLREVTGFKVFENKRSVGHVRAVLFHPEGRRVIGLAVERPNLALVVPMRERYVALDRVSFRDGYVDVKPGRDSWGKPAASRLGIDWDLTVIWSGMPVRTERGLGLGVVRDGVFAENTGELNALGLSAGIARDATIGVRDLAASLVVGFDGDVVRVRDDAGQVEMSGGAAAAAGRGTAVAKHKVGQAAETAAVVAGRGAAIAKQRVDEATEAMGPTAKKAAAYGSATVEAVAKSETARKAKGWLKAIKDEVVDAMGAPDDEEK